MRTFVLAKAILFLFVVVTFIAYNFWELRKDSRAVEKDPEDPSGQVSELEEDSPDTRNA